MKIGQTRKSKNCPKLCTRTDCYEEVVERTIQGKKYLVWKLHCKTLDKMFNKVLKTANKIYK